MLTRKHFNAMAEALLWAHPIVTGHDTPEARAAWQDAVNGIAAVCEDSNPRFDRVRFTEACMPAERV